MVTRYLIRAASVEEDPVPTKQKEKGMCDLLKNRLQEKFA